MMKWFDHSPKFAYLLLIVFFTIIVNYFYLNAWSQTPAGASYTGINLLAGNDKLVYYSMIEQGRRGAIMMKNLHTSEPQKGLFFSPHWWIIGQTANWLNLKTVSAYHLWRLILTGVFGLILYLFLVKLFKSPTERILSAAVVLFSSGVGWYLIFYNPAIFVDTISRFDKLPVDTYITELFPFFTFGQSPLFMLSHIFLLLIFYLFVKWRDQFRWQQELITGCLTFNFILIHPYNVWIIVFVLSAWSAWYFYSAKQLVIIYKLAVLGFFILAAVLYLLAALKYEPTMAGWLNQNFVYSNSLKNYLYGLGFIIPLWLYGSFIVWKKYKNNVWWILLLTWSWLIWPMIYLPIMYNRRFSNAWLIPLGLIAFLGLSEVVKKLKSKYLKSIALIISCLLLFSSSLISIYAQTRALNFFQDTRRIYLSAAWVEALDYLKQQTNQRDIILTSNITPLLIPAFSGRTVFIGHAHQTANYLLKEQQAYEFWADSNVSKRIFLAENHISYLVIDLTNKKDSQYDWLATAPFVKNVFTSDQVLIYRVLPSQ